MFANKYPICLYSVEKNIKELDKTEPNFMVLLHTNNFNTKSCKCEMGREAQNSPLSRAKK